MWKLFSSGGAHVASAAPKMHDFTKRLTRPSCITFGDVAKASLVILLGTVVGGCLLWMSSAEATAPADAAVQTEIVEPVHAHPTVEPAKLVTVNEALSLAIGIDAVISSVDSSGSASDVTMIMVGNVILNRVEDKRYPNSVDQVLCQPQQFSCFADTGIKWVGRAATDPAWKQRCMEAAERVLAGERLLSYGVVYVSGTKQGIVEAQLDGLYFCR